MKLYLYQCLCENNRLDKRGYLTQLFELDGTLREECSLITPVIQVQLIELAKIVKANYAYIPDFGRYYYIDDIVGERTGIVSLYMRSDPLMSFREGILDLNVFCSRNEYDYEDKLIDNKLPALSDYDISKENFTELSKFNQTPYYCIVYSGYTASRLPKNSGLSGLNCQVVYTTKQGLFQFFTSIGAAGWDLSNLFKSDPSQCIISVSCIPVNITQFPQIIERVYSEGKYNFNVGGNTFTINRNTGAGQEVLFYEYNPDSDYSQKFDVVFVDESEFNCNNISKSVPYFINFSPYTELGLRLPYIGYTDIDSSIIMKYDKIKLKYIFSSLSGTLEVDLSGVIGPNEYPIRVFNTNLKIDLPITTTNNNEINRSKIFGGLSLLTSIVSGSVGGFISSQTVGETTTVTERYADKRHNKPLGTNITREKIRTDSIDKSKIINTVGSTTIDVVSSLVQKLSPGSFSGDITTWFFSNIPCLIRTQIKLAPVALSDNYSKLLGRPSIYNGKLSGLKGYTEIAGVHIEFNQLNSSPTNEERDEIDGDLRSGIILPDIYRSFSLTMKGVTTDILYWNGKTYTKDVSESTKTFEMSIPIENFTEDIITHDRISSVTFNNCTGTYTDYSIHFNSANDNSSIEINFTIN